MAKAQLNRRRFLGTSAGVAGGAFFAPNILRSQGGESPNNKLRVACISVGGKGESDSNAAADGNDIVAIVDVDQARLDKAKQKYTGAEALHATSARCSTRWPTRSTASPSPPRTTPTSSRR